MIGTPVSHLHAYQFGHVRAVTPLGLVAILKEEVAISGSTPVHSPL